MPFIPHTDQDVAEMLAAIGAANVEELFDEIPAELQISNLANVPEGLTEAEVTSLLQRRAS